LGKTIPEVGKLLKQMQTDRWVNLDVQEEFIDVKFFGVISPRLQEVSIWIYKKMLKTFETERRLLDFMFLSLKVASGNSADALRGKSRQRLSVLLKHYALAEDKGIELIYEPGSLDSMLKNLRVGDKDARDILDIFYHLLDKNRETFLPEEVQEICTTNDENHMSNLSEYICLCLVRTMCGQPPKKISLFDLNIKSLNVEFQKVEFDFLLELARQSLEKFIQNNN
jgi:hypothetical protein